MFDSLRSNIDNILNMQFEFKKRVEILEDKHSNHKNIISNIELDYKTYVIK